MTLPLMIDALKDLPRTPATEVKTKGWRGLMKTIGTTGKVVITHHSTPEAVILSAQEYEAIAAALRDAALRADPALEALRHRFDERMAALNAPDAGERLRSLMLAPVRLNGELKAGQHD